MCRCCHPTLSCPLCLGWCGDASLEHGQGPAYPVTSRQVGTPHSRAGRVTKGLDVPGARPPGPPLLALSGTGSLEVKDSPARSLAVEQSPDVPRCPFSHRHEWCNLCGLLGAGEGRWVPGSLCTFQGVWASFVSTLLPCLAVGVEMGHSWPLLGFPCGVSLLGTEAGPPWGWRLVFAALGCLSLSHPGHGPEGTE